MLPIDAPGSVPSLCVIFSHAARCSADRAESALAAAASCIARYFRDAVNVVDCDDQDGVAADGRHPRREAIPHQGTRHEQVREGGLAFREMFRLSSFCYIDSVFLVAVFLIEFNKFQTISYLLTVNEVQFDDWPYF